MCRREPGGGSVASPQMKEPDLGTELGLGAQAAAVQVARFTTPTSAAFTVPRIGY